MITLYSKDFTTEYGAISSLCEAFVEEERNGLFELSFIMLNTDSLFNYVKEENIVVVNANDTLLNQKFRIYMTRKLMNNRVEVYARHISFDLIYDYIDNVSFTNQSCEYALNQLFRNSNFSKHYRGYSDIVNAQNYSMSMANVLEAIGGKKGSVIDTFGTGAEILRDNENISVLNKRGYDNEVTIEYKKNLTGFELEEDTTDLVTRISPYAKYNDSETNEEIIVKADYVDSTLIANYSHPYIKSIDYSDKFKDGEIPTVSKLQDLARKEYKNNKVDIPKQNFKIEFIPLSKCVGYEGLKDKISLCDTVTIIDTRYNIKTQSKVIKTVFNVLKNRYESMELGEPRTSLGDVIGGGNNEPVVGPPGPQGPPGQDGSVEDFPDTLPSTPTVTTTVYGFANIEVSWTFENKIYYQYEVYASKEANFTPNTFNLIHQGQTSTFMYQAKPNEKWHFKVCAINSYGNRTSFGSAYATTIKIDDLSNYVENMAINDALIGTLNLGRGWIGELKGNYIDAKNLSVTDGNGKRTLDIDSFGNVSFSPKLMRVYTDDKVELISNNGNKNMLLYGGQVCIYNNADNTFMSTMGNVLRSSDFNYKGIGFLAGKNCNTFTIGHDENWEDIQLDRSPNPLGIFFINFSSINAQQDGIKGIHLRDITYTTGDICGIGSTKPSIYGFNFISASSMSYDNWRSSIDNSLIMRFNGGTNKLNLGKTLNANGYGAEDFSFVNTSKLYIDNVYALNNNYGKILFRTNGWDMFNGCNWNWQGYNILDPVIRGGSYGYSINPNDEAYSKAITCSNNINLDEVLDKINIYPARTTYETDLATCKTNSEISLEIDVTELRESENADMFIKKHNIVNSETGESEIVENIDMKSMLHLALLEIKNLKEEVKALKMKAGV